MQMRLKGVLMYCILFSLLLAMDSSCVEGSDNRRRGFRIGASDRFAHGFGKRRSAGGETGGGVSGDGGGGKTRKIYNRYQFQLRS